MLGNLVLDSSLRFKFVNPPLVTKCSTAELFMDDSNSRLWAAGLTRLYILSEKVNIG